ncbi:MAG: hypothetical protein GX895_11070 [Clostridiales bacterium]|uniref:hypothetical protein n=1 Tax=Clostridium sp. N3C TaxID=1776758 RepID=UPI00092E071E|nr:hypothetical protein [Clostridium sp. N3C]NLZ49296.1 hypothetical protein [Clostridiales bacterium]SCN23765.1 hypothetical protein N3C_1485 [Clostridium sp. N3C]
MLKKATYKSIILLAILVLILAVLNPIFVLKVNHRAKLYQGLYDDSKTQYDVALFGSSHMNGLINPNILWKEHGITSFNYATGGQPIDVTYYLLKEFLKNHYSPIVVLDVYYLGLTTEYGDEAYIRYVLDNMKFSKNKIEAILNSTPRGEWANYFFPIIKYHSRWKELNESDFQYDYQSGYFMKGFGAGEERYGQNSNSDISTKESAELPKKSEEYLYKFIQLSKEKGFKLILVNAPYDYTSTAGFDNWHQEPAKMYNKIAEIAEENKIPFINYNNLFDEIGFDFKNDMNNIGHVNIWGAKKVTEHLGKYLKDNYELEDHRNDKKYEQWNKDYEQYEAIYKDKLK